MKNMKIKYNVHVIRSYGVWNIYWIIFNLCVVYISIDKETRKKEIKKKKEAVKQKNKCVK